MVVWVDAQVSPAVAGWLHRTFGVDAHAVRDLGLREAEDPEIFARARAEAEAAAEAARTRAARAGGAAAPWAVLSKDSDFVDLVTRHGPPPQVVWLTCGNTSNPYLRRLLAEAWPRVAALLAAGEPLVELSDRAA